MIYGATDMEYHASVFLSAYPISATDAKEVQPAAPALFSASSLLISALFVIALIFIAKPCHMPVASLFSC